MARAVIGIPVFDLYIACSQQDRFATEIERALYVVAQVYRSKEATPSDRRKADEYYAKTVNMFKWTSE